MTPEIDALKIRAYDILAMQQAMAAELEQINAKIGGLYQQAQQAGQNGEGPIVPELLDTASY